MLINHYNILGVSETADLAEINAAWKRLLKKYHPDLNQDDEDANEQAVLINQAYETLSNPKKRARFDRKLKQQRERTREETESDGFASGEEAKTSNSTQPFSASAEESFAGQSKSKSKRNNQAALMTVTGIVLGAITAIPIGLFLVWTISGFDPLGIFRVEQKIARREADESNDDAADDGSPATDTSVEKSNSDVPVKSGDNQSTHGTNSKTEEDTKAKEDPAGGNQLATNSDESQKQPQPGTAVGQPKEDGAAVEDSNSNQAEQNAVPENPSSEAVATKIAIPDLELVKQAKLKVAEVFKPDYEAAKSKTGLDRLIELKALAKQILDLLPDENNPIDLYAIYEVAIDIAKQSCFALDALKIVGDFEKKFEIDGMQLRVELFTYWHAQLPRLVKDPDERRSLFVELGKAAKPFADQTVKDKTWTLGLQFTELLRKLYIAGGNREAALKIEKSLPELRVNSEDEQQVVQYLSLLNRDPEQPEKQHVVGCFYCFIMDEWDKGLPYLEQSNQLKLADCAARDLAIQNSDSDVPTTTSELVGDLWWDLADDEGLERYQTSILSRAEMHYHKAIVGAEGIRQAKLKQRIEFITPPPKIVITNARFGWNRKWTNATEAIKKIYGLDPPVFTNSARGMGVADPIPKIRKVTVISFTVDGTPKSVRLKAGPSLRYNLNDYLK